MKPKKNPLRVGLQEVMDIMKVQGQHIYGLRRDLSYASPEERLEAALRFSQGLDFNWELSFGVNAGISIRPELIKGQSGNLVVSVGASASNKSVTEAVTFAKLYQQVAELAMLMQIRLDYLGPFDFSPEPEEKKEET